MWNEIFTLDVETGREVLEVLVYDKDDFGSDDFQGRITLRLDDYRDQISHDEWFDLEPERPQDAQDWHGKIRLVLHYVYSKTRLITNYI